MSREDLSLKATFFSQLKQFNEPKLPDNLDDPGVQASKLAMGSHGISTNSSSDKPNDPQKPNLVVEITALPIDESLSRSKGSRDTCVSKVLLQNNQSPDQIQSALSKAKTTTTSTATGKRKRGSVASEIPQQQRVFHGLKFFFIPNNDISPTRRIRIQKAVEYGAERMLEWDSAVTHIIVDKDLTYTDVLKCLKLPSLPAGMIMVNENYTAECISWRSLVLPTLGRFRVRGHDIIQVADNPAPLDSHLPIKRVGRGETVLEQQTPSRTDESSRDDLNDFRTREQQSPQATSNVDVHTSSNLARAHPEALQSVEDPLREVIASAKATAHLPLDSDDEDESRPSTADTSAESSESEHESPLPRKVQMEHAPHDPSKWQEKFQCMQDHNQATDKSLNPNIRTINILQEMENYYYSVRDQWRTRAYRQAIATLRKQTTLITSKEQAEFLPFIGSRLAVKIEEIVWTNRLRRLENAQLEPTEQALQLFLNVYGSGFIQASKWVQQGYRTLADLVANAKLTPNQRIGIDHYDDFRTRIPRDETTQLGAIVESALHEIDPAFETMIGGSYRRGAKDSGDIDMLITKKGAMLPSLRMVVLETLVPILTKRGFLVAALAVTHHDTGSKWHGSCQLPLSASEGASAGGAKNTNPWRRIDFLLVPYCELGAARLYFTGNDIFNRSMRLLARKKGMRLNQRGLYKDVLRDNRGIKKLTEGTKIAGESEREIFEILGVPWREAWERDI